MGTTRCRDSCVVWAASGIAFVWCLAMSARKASAQIDIAKFVTIRQGQIPIIISAPHGGEVALPGVPDREKRGQRFFETVRDQRTLELSERLAAHLARQLGGAPYVVLARFERRHVDANRAPEDAHAPPGNSGPKLVYDAYHKAMTDAAAEVTRRWGRGLLLDIHGQARFPGQVIRGTANGRTVRSLVERFGEKAVVGPRSVFGALAAKGYRIAPTGSSNDNVERYFAGGYIVGTYGSGRSGTIDAIQIEIGSHYRTPARLERTALDLAAAIAVFAKSYLPKGSTAVR